MSEPFWRDPNVCLCGGYTVAKTNTTTEYVTECQACGKLRLWTVEDAGEGTEQ